MDIAFIIIIIVFAVANALANASKKKRATGATGAPARRPVAQEIPSPLAELLSRFREEMAVRAPEEEAEEDVWEERAHVEEPAPPPPRPVARKEQRPVPLERIAAAAVKAAEEDVWGERAYAEAGQARPPERPVAIREQRPVPLERIAAVVAKAAAPAAAVAERGPAAPIPRLTRESAREGIIAAEILGPALARRRRGRFGSRRLF
ncbi:MAG: hypothetical protein PHN82_07870 [bacterium]|nr:hypothetical protein [bacterium]